MGRLKDRLVGWTVALAVVFPLTVANAQDRGIQLSLDGTRVLVNKDVGEDRWGIALNTLSQTITGNVFPGSGGEPIFIFCEPEGLVNTWSCRGSGPCVTATCTSQYTDFGVVTLPADFFSPPGFNDQFAVPSTAPPARAANGAATNGFQETPDGMHVLVSKDINGERWAITLNRDDRTLTGNVFFPEGGDPAFVSCGQDLGGSDSFRCSGAGPCVTDGCMDQYNLIGTVALPDGFFGPSTCGNFKVEASERCEADTACVLLCGVDVVCGPTPIPLPGLCSDDCSTCRTLNF